MRRLIASTTLIVLLGPETFARLLPATLAREQSLVARVTVYWASGGKGSDRYTRKHKCATGMRLRTGHCAVDPGKIPYGSKIVFPDGTSLAAVDTGTAVKNRKAARKAGRTASERSALVIDRFFETKRQALSWANNNPLFIPVRVVPPIYRPVQSPIVASNSATTTAMPANNPTTTPSAPPVTRPLLANKLAVLRSPLNRIGR
jgi:3D (Asp-Asp-Asp) domain-containing protein